MPNDFLPLSGAILVTNPRNKVNTMALALDNYGALALDNPNDRRRTNKLARLVVQHGMTPAAAVALWESEKNTGAKQRDPRLQNFGGGGKGTGAAMVAHLVNLPRPSKDERKARAAQYRRAKDAIAREFAKLPGYGPSTRQFWKNKVVTSYPTRLRGSKAKRYYTHRKKNERLRYDAFGRKGYQVVNVPSIREVNALRGTYHQPGLTAGGQKTLGSGKGKGRSADIIQAFDAGDGTFYKLPVADWSGFTHQVKGAKYGRRRKKGGSRRSSGGPRQLTPKQIAAGFGGAAARDAARNNPGVFGALALDNPRLQGIPAAAMYAGTVAAGAAVGGYAIKWLSENEMVEETIAKIPVVSQYPYALTGILGGLAVGFAASKVGGDAGKWLGLAAGGMIAAGGAIQLWEGAGEPALVLEEDDYDLLEEEDLGALALDNDGVFGALALDNEGVFGGLGALALDNEGVFGDGMAYEIGPLTQDEFAQSYGDASLADAYFSGADLDVEEGQSLMEGAPEFQRKFGHPPKRIALHGGKRGGPSHLAGRRGHRWGWLFKLLGKGRAQRLASMPPSRRVTVIRKLRENAIKTFNESLARLEGAPEFRPEHVSGGVPQSANGPQGANSSYGAMLFAGDDI